MVMAQAIAAPALPAAGPRCPECGNTALVPNPEGFMVCPACGVMDDTPPLVVSDALGRQGVIQSHNPLNPLGTTIGTRWEKTQAPLSLVFAERIAKTYAQDVANWGHFAVNAVLAQLHLDARIAPRCEAAFLRAYKRLPPRSRARGVPLLALAAVARVANLPFTRALNVLPAGKTEQDLRNVWRAALPYLPRPGLLAFVNTLLKTLSTPARACQIARDLARRRPSSGKPQVWAGGIVLVAYRSAGILRHTMPAYVVAQHAGVTASALIRVYDRLCANQPELRQQVHLNTPNAPRGLGASRVIGYLRRHPDGEITPP